MVVVDRSLRTIDVVGADSLRGAASAEIAAVPLDSVHAAAATQSVATTAVALTAMALTPRACTCPPSVSTC